MAGIEISGEEVKIKELKPLALPMLSIFLVVALFIVGFSVAKGQIEDKRSELKKITKDERVLEQKQQVLTEVRDEVLTLANTSTDAIPEKNSSLIMTSLVKRLAGQRLLTIPTLTIGRNVEEGNLARSQIQFDAEGDINQVLGLVSEIAEFAPLSRLDSVSLNQTGNEVRASVSISVYSGEFPEQLPPLTEPLEGLTDQEREVLGIITELGSPPFSGVSAGDPSGRGNPFE